MKYIGLCRQWQDNPRREVASVSWTIGRSYAATPTQVSTVFTLPAHAVQNLGAGRRRPCSAGVLRSRLNINGIYKSSFCFYSRVFRVV
jgi:hypothetical protein